MKPSNIHPRGDFLLSLEGLGSDRNYEFPQEESSYQSGANLAEQEDFESTVRKEVGPKVEGSNPKLFSRNVC